MFNTLFVEPLFNILFALYAVIPGHDFGLAVLALTILVRLALWPLVTKQLHSQRAIQKLQPEVARIKAEAGGDRQKETQMLMELYKERGTSPFASILPLIVQLPIFIALYFALMDSVNPEKISEMAYSFVRDLGPVKDIIANNSRFSPTLFGSIDLTKPHIVLAVLAAAAQYIQAKQLQPKDKSAMGDQAKIMSSMVVIFPIITFVIALTLPSALALYWAGTSAVAILQQYLVLLRDAEELEEAPKVTVKSATPATKSPAKRKKRSAKGGKK